MQPAVVLAHCSVVSLVQVEVVAPLEKQVVAVVVCILELGNDVHVVDADVDADVRVATPPEVSGLRRVGDVELLLQVFSVVQILGQNIAGELNFQP